MNLTPEQLLDAVHNVLYATIDEAGLHPHRFTDKQLAAYAARAKSAYAERAKASANVTLDFVTDSDFLELALTLIPSTGYTEASIDFLIDGALYDTAVLDTYGTRLTAHFEKPAGSRRITVFFPWSAGIVLHAVTLSDGASFAPVEKSLRILALGDSITQGYTAKHPSLSYVGKYTAALDAEVLDQGVGGYRFLKESLSGGIPFAPDIITLAYGTNDFSINSAFAIFKRDAGDYLARLHELFPATPTLMITPIYRGPKPRPEHDYTFDEACDTLAELGSAYDNITVLDGRSFSPRLIDFFESDYLHPNDLGFSLYGEAVINALRELI